METNTLSICILLGLFMAPTVEPNQVDLPDMVDFNVICNELNIEKRVSLVPAETFLANGNLPVWLITADDPPALASINYVMKDLGPFTVYRDPNTCSTALYFHNKQQFEGTIGHHHIIRHLNYNPTTKKVEVSEHTVVESPLEKHGNRLIEGLKANLMQAGSVYHNTVKSLMKYPDVVYIETLVLVDYDITKDFDYHYGAVVTYVLTLFNTVDMLFSSIEIPNIRINIAAILIVQGVNSLPFVEECRTQLREDLWLDVNCANRGIKRTLHKYKEIPFQSYDIVVFLTRASIYSPDSLKSHHWLFGISFFPIENDGFKRTVSDIGTAIISEPQNFEKFPTVAHEIAHLLGVPHDGGLLWRKDGSCKAHLMKKSHTMCFQCLRFGGKSPKRLKEFFGTREGCIFHNKPRSLEISPNPQLFWTIDDQCKCYGYNFNLNPRKSSVASQFLPNSVKCDDILKCVDENRESHDTSSYMNGTPCDKRQVCWDKQCVHVQNNDNEGPEDERNLKRVRVDEQVE